MKKLRVGVIGAGRIGKVHTESIVLRVKEAEVVALSDVALETARQLAGKFGIPKVTADYKEIFNDKDINAVVICSPTNTHAQYIKEAAAKGKDIFCEKPIDLSLAVIKEALAAVKKEKVKLMVGFNRRFDANFLAIRGLVKEGKIGTPHLLRITSRDPSPPPAHYVAGSGGMFLDMSIHDFDMARYIVGSEVVEVFAKGGVLVDPELGKAGDIDTAIIMLTFANGAIGAIDNSRKAVYGYDQRVEIFGTKGMAQTANNIPANYTFNDEKGSHGPHIYNFFMDRYTESYAVEMECFCRAVLKGECLPVSGEDALAATAMAIAAKISMKENRPVRIDEVVK